MPSRRQFLGTAAVALGGSVATAGCITVPASSDDPDETQSAPRVTAETTGRTSTDTTAAPTTTHGERRRARGGADPITVEETIRDSEYVYVESNDTVRYPAVKSGDEVLEYGHDSFDDWTSSEGVDVGVHAVYNLVDERVGREYGGSVRAGPDGSAVVSLRVVTRVDRDGDVVSEPDVSFADLVAAAPRSVTSTIHFAGKSATHTHEVWVRRVTRQDD